MSDHFDEKAKTWDADDFVRQLSSAISSAILEHAQLHPQMSVMDFGAGTGLISSHVAPRVSKITAVDISRAMLDRLIAKPELQGKVDAVCQNILEQPLADQFDLNMSAMAMHHVEDTRQLLQTFAEHLKPGASIALADLDKEDGSFHPADTEGVYHSGFERDYLQGLLEAEGFGDVRFVTAHRATRDNGREYPIFLVTATKG